MSTSCSCAGRRGHVGLDTEAPKAQGTPEHEQAAGLAGVVGCADLTVEQVLALHQQPLGPLHRPRLALGPLAVVHTAVPGLPQEPLRFEVLCGRLHTTPGNPGSPATPKSPLGCPPRRPGSQLGFQVRARRWQAGRRRRRSCMWSSESTAGSRRTHLDLGQGKSSGLWSLRLWPCAARGPRAALPLPVLGLLHLEVNSDSAALVACTGAVHRAQADRGVR